MSYGQVPCQSQMKRLSATITGRVQGVSYRYYARREASSLGLTGWIRNETDGSVQIVAEGDEESLKELLRYLNQGSPLARVERVDFDLLPASGEFTTFYVRF